MIRKPFNALFDADLLFYSNETYKQTNEKNTNILHKSKIKSLKVHSEDKSKRSFDVKSKIKIANNQQIINEMKNVKSMRRDIVKVATKTKCKNKIQKQKKENYPFT